MSARFVLRWLAAFVFTQAVEIPIYRRTLHRDFWPCFGASATTHPLVWLFLSSHLCRAPWSVQVASVEVFAWLTEAAYFRFGWGRRRALLWALVANGASLTLGLASRRAFGGP